MHLTEEQREIVESPERSILVVAGPGTGKTAILTERFSYLVKNKNINRSRILAITYTNKATSEMRGRINLNLSKSAVIKAFPGALHIKTFHKFCDWIRNEYGDNTKECNHKVAIGISKSIMEELGMPKLFRTTETFFHLKRVRLIEKRQITEDDVLKAVVAGSIFGFEQKNQIAENFPLEKMNEALDKYIKELDDANYCDIDDLIIESYLLLESSIEMRNKISERFDAIFVDEFQDIDSLQLQILLWLRNPRVYTFFVGDPDQSIYSFRGAVPEIFDKYKKAVPETKTYNLTLNFRCPDTIQKLANEIISKNTSTLRKEIKTKKESGAVVEHKIFNTSEEEDDFIISTIEKLTENEEIDLEDIAVLYRKGRNSDRIKELQRKLINKNIDFSAEEFLDDSHISRRKEINDIIAWTVIAIGKDQKKIDNAIRRIMNRPSKGIGRKTKQKIEEFMKEHQLDSFEETINRYPSQKLIYVSSTIERVRRIWKDENREIAYKIREIFEETKIREYFKRKGELERCGRIEALIEGELLQSGNIDETHIRQTLQDWSEQDVGRDAVFFDTIHQAKGLESKYVFLINWNEGDIPHKRSIQEGNEAEERRVAYVGITRTSKRLWITSSKGENKISEYCHEIKHLVK